LPVKPGNPPPPIQVTVMNSVKSRIKSERVYRMLHAKYDALIRNTECRRGEVEKAMKDYEETGGTESARIGRMRRMSDSLDHRIRSYNRRLQALDEWYNEKTDGMIEKIMGDIDEKV